MFYKTTKKSNYTARVKQINIIYQEHTIRNTQNKYQGVICTQRHHTMKILYRYINSSLCHNIKICNNNGIYHLYFFVIQHSYPSVVIHHVNT